MDHGVGFKTRQTPDISPSIACGKSEEIAQLIDDVYPSTAQKYFVRQGGEVKGAGQRSFCAEVEAVLGVM